MRTWWKETAGGLPRTFWVLWTGNLINRAGGFVAIVLAFYLRTQRGFDASTVGLVIGLIGAGGMLGTLAGGQLADRWGRRASLFTAQLASAVAMLGLGFSRRLILIAVAAALLGATQSMARPAFSAMMTDTVTATDRRRAFSLNYWANNLAFTIAALLGGLVAGHDYTAVFLVDAGTTVAAAVAIFLNAPETLPQAAPGGGAPASASGRGPWRDVVFLLTCAMGFLGMLVFFQYQSTLPLTMTKDGLSAQVYGAVVSINAVMIVLGQLWVPKLTEKWDDHRVLAGTSLLVGIGFGLTGLAHGIPLYVLSVVIWSLGEMFQSPASSSLIAGLCPSNARGRYIAAYSLGISAASFAAPVVGGLVLDHLGRGTLWTACFVLSAALGLAALLLAPSRTRRLAELAEAEKAPAEPAHA